jgi:cytochrome c
VVFDLARMSIPVRRAAALGLTLGGLVLGASAAPAGPAPAGDAARGAAVFGQCAACHAVEPGRHLTGPSLAGVWGRKAGTTEGFTRYSDALKQSGLVWDDKTLDAWLRDPQRIVPGTSMTFPGLPNARQRADVIAYLKAAHEGERAQAASRGGGMRGGGMMGRGMMGAGERPNLKAAGPERQVTAIRYCGDGYRVTTAAGQTQVFWEMNLRFKTDSSPDGPPKGKPVLLPAGMMGDRASVVFAAPEEISHAIKREC